MFKKWRWIIAVSLLLFIGTASAQVHTFLIHDFKFGDVALAEEVRSVHKGNSYTLVVILSSNYKSARIENVTFENSSLHFDSMPARINATNWVINLNMTESDTATLKTILVKVNYTFEGADGNLTNQSEYSKIDVLVGPPLPSTPQPLALFQVSSPEFQDMLVVVKGTLEQIKQEQNTGFYRITISDDTAKNKKIISTNGGYAAGDLVKVTGIIRFDGEIYSSDITRILQLRIEAPPVPELDKEYNIKILADDRAVSGATVIIGESIYVTDANGTVVHKFSKNGTVSIEAKKEDYLSARTDVMVKKTSPGFEFPLLAVSMLLVYACFQRKLLKR